MIKLPLPRLKPLISPTGLKSNLEPGPRFEPNGGYGRGGAGIGDRGGDWGPGEVGVGDRGCGWGLI